MALLEMGQVKVSYEKAQILHGVSLTISPHEIVSIIGPNGAGKTSMLRAISGLVPYEGTIRFSGESLETKSSRSIVGAGLIHCPEGRLLFGEMTVMENLEMGSFLRRDRDEIAVDYNRILELFPVLGERSKQIAGTLSGGEQQMVAVARAMMSKPKLLMFDEPSFGLAPLIKKAILSAIKKIAATEATVLLVEQDVRLAVQVAERFYVLELGKITFEGSKEDLLKEQSLVEVYLGIS